MMAVWFGPLVIVTLMAVCTGVACLFLTPAKGDVEK